MASAKISMRTAEGQNPNKLLAFLDSHIRKQLRKKDFTLVIHSQVGCSAAVMDISHRIFKVAEKACELNFKNNVFYQRMGGSIPVVGFLQNELSLTSLLIGFGLESDNIHAPNEHYHLDNYYTGIKTISEILKTKFNDKDVTAIEIVEIEHPMLGGIVSTIQLNDEQKKKFLSDFDKLKNKGIGKCRSNYVIRIILESKTLKLKVCGNSVSNRVGDIYYELPNGKSIIDHYLNK